MQEVFLPNIRQKPFPRYDVPHCTCSNLGLLLSEVRPRVDRHVRRPSLHPDRFTEIDFGDEKVR